MSEDQQIIYMQARIVRCASEKWNMSIKDIVLLFSQYEILQFIRNCFCIFHIEGDEAILEDVEKYLGHRGKNMCKS